MRRIVAIILMMFGLTSPVECKLQVDTSADFLTSDKSQSNVTVRGIDGVLAITITNPGTIHISNIRRSKTAVTFAANRIAGGDAAITLSDDSGDYSKIDVPLTGCSWPAPEFRVDDPLPSQTLLRIVSLDVTEDWHSIARPEKRLARRFVVRVSRGLSGDTDLRQFRIHVFAEDGDDQFFALSPIRAKSATHVSPMDWSIEEYDYFESFVTGLRPNHTYDVQLIRPGYECLPAILDGGFISKAAAF